MAGEPVAIITGAAGGMGTAIARLLGHGHRLVLNDVSSEKLESVAQSLRDEGNTVDTLAGDLSQPGVAGALVARVEQDGQLRAVINAAGLSPIQADWQTIVAANAIGPARLLAAVEPLLTRGTACVMIASPTAHREAETAKAHRG